MQLFSCAAILFKWTYVLKHISNFMGGKWQKGKDANDNRKKTVRRELWGTYFCIFSL